MALSRTALERATWPEVAAASPAVVLVPVGSCEQHGPHLPFDTDTRIAVAVATRVAEARSDVLVAPALAYGSSGEHQAFAGTLSIGTEALVHVLVELGRSAFPEGRWPHRSLVFVNGHGGNTAAVRTAVETLVGEGRPVEAWWPSFDADDAHAGRTETSLLLAIAPGVVGEDRPVGATEPLAELIVPMRAGGVAAVSANGVLGDATGASAALGAAILDEMVRELDTVIAANIAGTHDL
ncbi:MAG: mycofactocin biosynthesis peptidyl-dipeptidase MftE [Acidimicrobiales bacterium]|nr:mycofactocin biosynthesis peptidyl-dipeptidase MftE [Acidimicrobiales bacterium]